MLAHSVCECILKFKEKEIKVTVCVDVGMLCDTPHTNININSVIASVQISTVSSAGSVMWLPQKC